MDVIKKKPEPVTAQAEPATKTEPEPVIQPITDDVGTSSETPPEKDAGADVTLSLSDVALALGVDEKFIDVDDEGVPIFKAKIDGEEQFVKVNDLITSYQLRGHLDKQNMEVAEQRKRIEQERNKFTQENAGRQQQMNDALQLLHANLNSEFQGVDWNGLRKADPQEYLRLRLDFEDRQKQIQQGYTILNKQREDQLTGIRSEQMTLLLDKVPEWKDAAKFGEAKQTILGTLDNYGFSKEEVGNILDHRFFLLARDAIAFRKQQAKAPELTNKVRTAPKVVKSGTPQPAASKEAALKALKEKIKQGKEGSVAAYLLKSGLAKTRR
jgi:hypothetical protein